MATFTWIDGNGSWTVAGNWNTDSVPNSATANVFIIDSTSTVTLSTSVSLDSLQLAVGNALDISSGSVLSVGSQIDNAGTILIAAGANNAALNTVGPVSLTGGGTMILSNGTSGNQALISQSTSGSPLTNVDNTIEGFGQIGVNGLALVNEGTVDANVSGQTLILDGSSGVANSGLLEATGSGALSITTPINNTGGDITADGATVAISNSAVITGGTLNTSGGGTLESVGGTEALNGVTISSGSTYTIGSGGVVQIEGTIDNAGTILIAAGDNNAALDTDGTVSLTGGGTVILSNGTSGNQALIAQSAGGSPLTNVDNTIEGFGEIGSNSGLALVNEGTIDANVSGQTLILDGSSGVANSGLLEATGSGALSITTSVNNSGGDITADGATIAISNSAVITGGTMNTSGGGTLESVGGTEALNGVTISSGSTYTIGSGGVVQIEGTIDNAGTILIAAGDNNAGLDTDGPVSLTGDGTVILSNGTSGFQALIAQSVASSPLTNVDNTIEGSGQIGGAGGLALVNEGTMDANMSGQTLILSGGGVTNSGLLEASNGGSLDVTTTLGGGGQIETGAGAELELAGATNETATFTGAVGAQLRLDAPASYTGTLVAFAPGETIDLVNIDATSAVISGTTLVVDISGGGTLAYAVSATYAGDHLMVGSDNSGGSDIIAYGLALPGSHAPEPVSLGDAHVGAVATQALSLTNTAPTNGYYETLDAIIGGATAGVPAGGSFSLLAAGATDSTHLVVGLDTSADGNKSGTATITLTSDGTGVDGLGTTAIGTQTVNINGAVYNYATASAAAPTPVNFGEHHVGDVLSQALSIGNTGTADGFTEKLDASIGNATGAASTSGAFSGLAAGASNSSSLMVGLSSTHDGAQSGTAKVALTSDGAGIDTLGMTALAAQTIAVEGTFYNYATASAAAPNPANFGEHHVGDVLSQALSISNLGTADGFTEKLDASIGNATGAASTSGAFSGLAVGASNSSSLTVGLSSAHDGAQSGTAKLTLTSNGSGIDTLGTTALAAQTIAVEGTLYNFATASAAAPTPVNFGEHHVGDVLSQALSVSNIGTADGFTEKLDASIGSATGAASASGTFSLLAAGGSNSSSLTVGLSSAHDGAQSGTAKLTLTSDGAGVDTLGTTPVTAQTIAVEGTFYNYATASAAASDPVNFGIVHVGTAVGEALSISNLATADGFSETLDGSIGNATGGVIAGGSFSGLAASATNTTSLSVGLNTSTAGTISGTATITLRSDGAGIDTLGTTTLAAQTVTVNGTVNNYATAEIEVLSGGGTLTQAGTAYTLALGTIDLDTADPQIDLGIVNTATGPADLLAGSFTVNGDGDVAFTNTLTAFSNVAAGGVAGGEEVSLSTMTVGVFSETITLLANGSNSSGYLGALPEEVLTVTGKVACFAAGTRIATEDREVAVEAIGVGDRVQVLLGDGVAEVIWVGRREVDCAGHAQPRKVWPVRVAAWAFGHGLPHTDLFLSPDHAVYLNDVLIPVRCLINGSTIVQVPVDRVTYHHIELVDHDVLLAEGLPAESFLDMRDGTNYASRPGPIRLYPDYSARMWEAFGCARLVVTGPELEAARAMVARCATDQAAV